MKRLNRVSSGIDNPGLEMEMTDGVSKQVREKKGKKPTLDSVRHLGFCCFLYIMCSCFFGGVFKCQYFRCKMILESCVRFVLDVIFEIFMRCFISLSISVSMVVSMCCVVVVCHYSQSARRQLSLRSLRRLSPVQCAQLPSGHHTPAAAGNELPVNVGGENPQVLNPCSTHSTPPSDSHSS